MMKTLKLIFDFLAAVISCFVLASLLHTQFVLHGLVELDVVIDWQTRLTMSGKDILGLLPSYGSLIAIALLIAFICVFFLNKVLTPPKRWLYPIAGVVAILTMLTAMQPVMDITLIAGARSDLGIAAQSLAGLFGGWVFMYQRGRRSRAA